MRASLPRPPHLKSIRIGDLPDGDPSYLEENTDLESVAYRGINTDALDLGVGSSINTCKFSDITADEFSVDSSRVVETLFEGVSFPSLRAGRATFRDVEFEASRLGSVDAFDTSMRSVRFRDCRINFINLRGAKLADVVFQDCVIDEIDIAQGEATRIAFPGTRLGKLSVHRTNVKDFDLRGAELGGVTGWASLAGAVVSEEQVTYLAPQMAAELGLRIS